MVRELAPRPVRQAMTDAEFRPYADEDAWHADRTAHTVALADDPVAGQVRRRPAGLRRHVINAMER